MKSYDIRKSFLEYFASQNHTIVKSSSLIPKNDPTLLFTNAGMVQFKGVFLGDEQRTYSRATTSQKCMRAGGKHSDLENVGHTARHHTFFEMLGNFSFGDYFKKDAISFAWQLLTEVYKLPKERLWASVFENDDESAKLWTDLTDIPESRIVRLGAKDNFWQMADTGPCGPCSEIIIDQGESIGCGRSDCKIGCDCDRYLELWNLVFMQFNKDSSGALTPLPKPSIDTGMGLERISAVLQGKHNNFDTDLFDGIIKAIETELSVKYLTNAKTDISIKVIADHLRSSVFLITDGLVPANDGRGYVLRRIIRRAARHAKLLGSQKAVMYKMVDVVLDTMADIYPELLSEAQRVKKTLQYEEERFSKTLDFGMRLLDDIMLKLSQYSIKTIPAEEVFKLYDTYGFPIDLAKDMAIDNGFGIDEAGFHALMQKQRQKAKASWVGEEKAIADVYKELSNKISETTFLGYESLTCESTVIAIVKKGFIVDTATVGDVVEMCLNQTVFYGESGGQTGDIGKIDNDTFAADVIVTKKELGIHLHHVRILYGSIKVGDKINCTVNEQQRFSTARNHTATHLLHTALRNIVGEHIKQAGSLVAPERLRFDFTHFYGLQHSEIQQIEALVNAKIRENIPIKTEIADLDEAVKSGVIALFNEKYGDKVRVVLVPGFSAELCGGTHCKATGDIGTFVIVSEGSVASGIRRIEALTGESAFEYLVHCRNQISALSEMLKTDNILERLDRLSTEIKELQKELQHYKDKERVNNANALLSQAKIINGINVLSTIVHTKEIKELRSIADTIRDKLGDCVIALASISNSDATIIVMVSKSLIKNLHAGNIIKSILTPLGGRGGGKPDLAQGGVSGINDSSLLNSALKQVYEIIKDSVPISS